MTGDGTAIRLDRLTKRFDGQDRPAVDALSLQVPRGQIVVLLGPSGCGKTTTLKMINRIVEPTSGSVFIDGLDVTDADPDLLRRRIGYVIQQVGLFPHMSVAQNVAVVPRLLGWDRRRTAARVDELLDLVGLPPEQFRDRYPRQLSGGQGQRVGVARALGGDPEVLLMDEPFGAIDPVTRERLQSELLDLQAQLGKTIVFVTHDLDEAVRLGDRIAILGQGGELIQYDNPDQILAAPADSRVAEFVGDGATLKRLRARRVADLALAACVTVGGPAAEPGRSIAPASLGWTLSLDEDGGPVSWRRDGQDARRPARVVSMQATAFDAVDALLAAEPAVVVVVDAAGTYCGVVDAGTVALALGGGPAR